ncbi:MAG: class I tRNA ligase family protein [Pirellulales bacterium]
MKSLMAGAFLVCLVRRAIGYIASTQQWCERNGEKLNDWWKSEQTEIHHFIGKDITYFHTLFWPRHAEDRPGFHYRNKSTSTGS